MYWLDIQGHLLYVTTVNNNFVKCSKNLFTLSHLNVRSLKSKIETLRVHMRDCSDVVLGISETWLEDINPTHNIDIAGYNFERLDRTWVKPDGDDKGGGWEFIFEMISPTQLIIINTSMLVLMILK